MRLVDADKLVTNIKFMLHCYRDSPDCSVHRYEGAQFMFEKTQEAIAELEVFGIRSCTEDKELKMSNSKIITEDMLVKFNSEVLQDSPLELRMCRNLSGCAECRLKSNIFIDSSIVNLNDTFFDTLKRFFKTYYNIELSFNNTGNIFWVRGGITGEM